MTEWIRGLTEASAGSVDYDERRLRRYETYLSDKIEHGGLQAASYLMARRGKIFAWASAGRLVYDDPARPLLPDSIKSIASISKVFTATAIMRLVEDGTLWLEQPVKTLIKEFDTPMHGKINLWHLLTHTSGLRADGGYFAEPYPEDRWEAFGRDDWIKAAVLSGPLQSEPGSQWSYCSAAFMVLAEIVSRVSGSHFNDFIQEELAKPLGLKHSFIEVPEALRQTVCVSEAWQREQLSHSADRIGAPNGGGGVFSTLYDLYRLGQCYLNLGELDGTRLLGKKTVQEMTRDQLDPATPAFHWGKRCKHYRQGLCWEFYADGPTVGPATYNHEGWGWCALFIDPVEDFVYIHFLAEPKEWDPELMVSPRTIAFSGLC